jgi:hypothetical protein
VLEYSERFGFSVGNGYYAILHGVVVLQALLKVM